MEMERYVDEVRQQLLLAADAGGEDVRSVAERLVGSVGPTVHLVVLDALADAAAELTAELAPGSVELRLRGREPSWVVSLPPAEQPSDAVAPAPAPPADGPVADTDDAELARINLRLPRALKDRVERAAAADGTSINAWLVRAVSAAADQALSPQPRRAATGGTHITGWVQ